jgi:hypothetical protein
VFRPQNIGLFVLLIFILAFIAGRIRGELVLTLTGAVFLAATHCGGKSGYDMLLQIVEIINERPDRL